MRYPDGMRERLEGGHQFYTLWFPLWASVGLCWLHCTADYSCMAYCTASVSFLLVVDTTQHGYCTAVSLNCCMVDRQCTVPCNVLPSTFLAKWKLRCRRKLFAIFGAELLISPKLICRGCLCKIDFSVIFCFSYFSKINSGVVHALYISCDWCGWCGISKWK